NQDGWEFKAGWKSGMAMGEWHGVTTNNAEGRVIGLELDENDLAGTTWYHLIPLYELQVESKQRTCR
ncbi:unnamed protein product, partial [Scytosiphon promiscuus]